MRATSASEIVPRFRNLSATDISSKSTPDDLVTAADLASEARLTKAISQLLPDALILGEEAVAKDVAVKERVRQPGMCVIIDPIDGTWNFAAGLSTFGVILAVTVDGETVFGLHYDPVMDDWIMARKDGGAWHCRPDHPPRQLSTAAPCKIPEMTGFLSLALHPKSDQRAIAALFPDFRRILTLRCSCHEYRTLAQGHVSFMVSGMLNPWDHAAGALIATEAGGVARMMDGRIYAPTIHSGPVLVASDEATWDLVHSHFQSAIWV